MLLVIDNYDSFTYNVVRYFRELGALVEVVRNDQVSLHELEALHPSRLVISPGPCSPSEAGISVEAIQYFAGKLPILGICLGHQCIAQAFGGKILPAKRVMHGKTSAVFHHQTGLFEGVPSPFVAARYHSLVIDNAKIPADFQVTAWTESDVEQNEIMAIKHDYWPIEGVQFHPEAVMTEHGHRLLKNYLLQTGESNGY